MAKLNFSNSKDEENQYQENEEDSDGISFYIIKIDDEIEHKRKIMQQK